MQGIRGHTVRQQPLERLVGRAALRRSAFALIRAPPADAVVLFGDVREPEECAHENLATCDPAKRSGVTPLLVGMKASGVSIMGPRSGDLVK